MKFSDIPGHEEVKNRLRDMADSNRIPHALLLEGPRGVGKFALARAFARYVLCENRHDGEACGHCSTCRQFDASQHVDVMYSFPVVKSSEKGSISDDFRSEFIRFIDEWPWMNPERWLEALDNPKSQPRIYVDESAELYRRLSFTAQSSKYKIVLMWLPERLEEAAANKLLKIVEEPYADTLFVFTSDEPSNILGTIYSRVQRIKVSRYTDEQIVSYLRTKGVDAETAASAAMTADGSMAVALNASNGANDNVDADMRAQFLDWFQQLMRHAWQRKMADLRKISEEVAAWPRERQLALLTYCSRMIRENFVANFHDNGMLSMNRAEAQFASRFARFINERNVQSMIALFDKAYSDIMANANAKIVFFDMAVAVFIHLHRK